MKEISLNEQNKWVFRELWNALNVRDITDMKTEVAHSKALELLQKMHSYLYLSGKTGGL